MKKTELTEFLQAEKEWTLQEKSGMVWVLAFPAIIAQLSSIIMQIIDASMVGSLGAGAAAAIGVVASTTWLFNGVATSFLHGFSVQVAHSVGAGNGPRARSVYRQGVKAVFWFALLFAVLGSAISGSLPVALRAEASICGDASVYFMIAAWTIPFLTLRRYASAVLQAVGNMRTPGILNSFMCLLDVIFNYLCIFPTRRLYLPVIGMHILMPGAGLGVAGAALGTLLAEFVTAVLLLFHASYRTGILKRVKGEKYGFTRDCMEKSIRISLPIAVEQAAICGAMVASTRIVSPLGKVALAANSFAITVESVCYMPGYGMQAAAMTLVGQCLGAGKQKLAKSFGTISVVLGMVVMGVVGLVMYFLCPYAFAFLTPDAAVQQLGVKVLRIELWAEPFFAASIVVTGVLRGAGDTLIPSVMNFISIWGVRITLALLLVGTYGLTGAWIAMCAELIFRGSIFLIRMKLGNWWKRQV